MPEVCLHWKKSPVLDSNLHTRLAIVTENELGLAFPPRNLPKKFRQDPSTFYSFIVVTNRQTDRQTNAGDSIIPRESFRGDNYVNKYGFYQYVGNSNCNATDSQIGYRQTELRFYVPVDTYISHFGGVFRSRTYD